MALDHAQGLAAENSVTIETKQTDLDMFLFGLMDYDSVIMMDFKPHVPRYYTDLIRLMKQGATLLIESSTVEEMRDLIPERTRKRRRMKVKALPDLPVAEEASDDSSPSDSDD